jgi:hypothetical protein
MKLRIHGNSLRLRLTRPEVERFAEQGHLEDAIEFAPNARFTYSLERSGDARAPRALYEVGRLRIQVPRTDADQWVNTDQVGISGGEAIAIAVEKDFKCMHGDSEEDADAYPNPLDSLTGQD